MPQNTERRIVGIPITGNNANRNIINRNMMNMDKFMPTSPNSTTNLISAMNGSPVLGNRELLSNSPVRKLDRSMSEPVGDRNSNTQQQQNQRQGNTNINSSRYKTELCRPFEENGYCKYGDKCQFAHGSHELRCLARHPKYKTELCRTFHTIGFCPYGPRCHFVHSEDEGKLVQINRLKQQLPLSPPLQQQQPMSPPQRQVSPAQTIQRPKGFDLRLAMQVRDSLGSTADSPPSSVTDSPTMSPTFSGEEYMSSSSMSSAFSPPASAPPGLTSAFQFPHGDLPAPVPSTPIMAPLNVHTDPIASLTAGFQAASLASNHRNNNNDNIFFRDSNMRDFYAPPSPPDSLSGDSMTSTSTCGSPLEVSRGLRLPIFSQLSVTD